MQMRALILFLLTSILFQNPLWAQSQDSIGVVVLTDGPVNATNKAGKSRALKRRSPLFVGDLIKVAPGATAQIRFSDNSMMTLKRNAEFAIEAYAHNSTTGSEFKASLNQGALRTSTGMISRANPKNYRLRTPVAGLGVRGTLYSLSIDPSTQKLNLAYFIGSGFVDNALGSLELGVDGSYSFGEVAGNASPRGSLADPVAFEDPVYDGTIESEEFDSEDSGEAMVADITDLTDEELDLIEFDLESDDLFDDSDFLDFEDEDFLQDDFVDDGLFYDEYPFEYPPPG